MSAPNEEKQEGLSQYMRRMRTVLRRGHSSKTGSVSSMQEVTGSESSKAAAPKAEAPVTKPATKEVQPTIISHWSAIQQEKARALFAKYGLTLEPGEWKSPSDLTVQRVTKPIRLRVRRTCHRCQTTFGPDKVCVNCQHLRCKKCPRYPPPKSKDAKEEVGKAKATEPKAKDVQTQRKSKGTLSLTIPSRTGGQDLVRKPIKQRVRRTCHLCDTLFMGSATECLNCKHIRCKKCPRDPPKLDKYPDGYPGDADPPFEKPERVWRKARVRVRYSCHKCSTLFRSGEKECSSCGEAKGPDTIRDPAKKIKPEPDPEILRRIEERLGKLEFTTLRSR